MVVVSLGYNVLKGLFIDYAIYELPVIIGFSTVTLAPGAIFMLIGLAFKLFGKDIWRPMIVTGWFCMIVVGAFGLYGSLLAIQ